MKFNQWNLITVQVKPGYEDTEKFDSTTNENCVKYKKKTTVIEICCRATNRQYDQVLFYQEVELDKLF